MEDKTKSTPKIHQSRKDEVRILLLIGVDIMQRKDQVKFPNAL